MVKWSAVLAKVKEDPDWSSQVRKRGVLPSIMTPEETRRMVESQHSAYRKLEPHFRGK